jgi:hypothetical protein
MAMINRLAKFAVFAFTLQTLAAPSARANLFSLDVAGTISTNTTGDPTIPVGTPFNFQLIYNAAAPDLAPSDPTFGSFSNTAAPPALVLFHYQAGSYEATLDDPADFGTFGQMVITFTTVNAIDINISAPTLFPHLAGGPVSFHADFNAFSQAPIFSSDALPTNTAINLASFDESTVTLLPPAGIVATSSLTSFKLTALAVPEPGTLLLLMIAAFPLIKAGSFSRSFSI